MSEERRTKLELISSAGCASLPQLDEDQLMMLVRRGHEGAFRELIVRHQALVLGYACRFLGDELLGAEVGQEVFLTLWSERERFKPQGRFKSYLMSIAYNRCQDAGRRRQRDNHKLKLVAERPDATAEETPLEKLLTLERQAAVQSLLARVDDRSCAVLVMRFHNGLSYREIATVTNQPEGTVKARVSRAVRKLHDMWREQRA